MTNARSFFISTLQELSNDTKNTSMRGVLGLAVELQTFGSPGGLQIPNFGSVRLHPHTWPKWGCDNLDLLWAMEVFSKKSTLLNEI
jgi:hypothetical protein